MSAWLLDNIQWGLRTITILNSHITEKLFPFFIMQSVDFIRPGTNF